MYRIRAFRVPESLMNPNIHEENPAPLSQEHEKHFSGTSIQNTSNIIYIPQVGEERAQICKFCIVWVVEPARDGDGVIGMEDV